MPPVGIPGQGGRGTVRVSATQRLFDIVCYGNSLTLGNGGANTYPAALQSLRNALRPGDNVINLGTNNQYTQQMLDNFVADMASISGSLTGKTKVVIWWESIDSMDDHGNSAAAEYSLLQSAATLCHANGWLILVAGAIPCTDPPASPSLVTDLAASLRSNHSWADGFCDLEGGYAWNVNDGAVYSNAGGSPNVHLTDYGYTGIVAPLFHAALTAMG